jgi:phytoene dehydrogenase-like protein
MESRYDAVVVGAGPNGLAAAVELTRRGHRVLVVEGRDRIGGGSRTAALTLEGFAHDVCAAVHPLGAGSPYLQTLPLDHYGLEWVHPPIPLAHPLEDVTVALHRSIDETAEALGVDGARYRHLVGPAALRVDQLMEGILGPLWRVPRHPLVLARFGMTAVRSAHAVGSRFTTEAGRALWAGLAAHSIAPLQRPLTSAVALSLAAAGHGYGFPFARGGSQAIVDALAAHLTDLGGHIETSRWIASLEQLPPADAYLLDVSPAAAAAIAGGRIRRTARLRLRRWRHGPGSFKVDYALGGPVPWRDATLRRAGTVHLGGTAAEIEASERAAATGEHPAAPFVLLSQPGVADDSRAPGDLHVVWAYCHVPSGSTQDMTAAVEAQIERYAPGFGSLVVARHVMGPADYEVYNPNNVDGDIAGGAFTVANTLARPLPGPNPYHLGGGVYLCSAATPPGAGVHGMCGFHAAAAAHRALARR